MKDKEKSNFREVPQTFAYDAIMLSILLEIIFSPGSSPNCGNRYEWHGILSHK